MPPTHHADPNAPVSLYTKPANTTLRENLTVAAAIESLRKRTIDERIVYFYVLNEEGRLLGVVPTRRLLLADPGQRIEEVMHTPVTTILGNAPLSEAMKMFAMHRFLALPVVDEQGRFQGTVDVRLYADEAVDMAEAQRLADVFQLIGVWVQTYQEGSPWRAYRLRMPWLVFNIIGGVNCALISTVFGAAIEQALIIAAFIPLVLALAESISIQSLTLGLQYMHASKVEWDQMRALARREWKASLLLGLTCAAVVGVAAFFWGDGGAAPLVIGGSILVTMSVAALLGVGIPTMLHSLRWDPKVAAGPLVLMMVDTVTLTTYLASATLWLV